MIEVQRLNGQMFYLNPHLIETIEATPDTVIVLTTGKLVVVKDSAASVVDKIIRYRQMINEKSFTDQDVCVTCGDSKESLGMTEK